LRSRRGITPPETDHPHELGSVLPGYNHIDVLTAAAGQNDGPPEPVPQAPADYAAG